MVRDVTNFVNGANILCEKRANSKKLKILREMIDAVEVGSMKNEDEKLS
jgi:hypothetical protein